MTAPSHQEPALRMTGVGVVRGETTILRDVAWTVAPDERWVVLGPNGSGKTTLLRIAGLYLHPSLGQVEVLGHQLGRVDVRRLRTRIGFVSPVFAAMVRHHSHGRSGSDALRPLPRPLGLRRASPAPTAARAPTRFARSHGRSGSDALRPLPRPLGPGPLHCGRSLRRR